MTEITKKPVLRTPLAIRWEDEGGFELSIEVRSAPEASLFLAPPLTPNDTGFLSAPPLPF